MKPLSLLGISLCFLFFACKKESTQLATNKENQEKVAIKFSISDFKHQVTDISASQTGRKNSTLLRDSVLEKQINHLYYLAYSEDMGYLQVSYKHQDATYNNYDFGNIRDSLTPGNYIIILVGSNGPSNFNQAPLGIFGDARLLLYSDANGPTRLPDTYLKKFSIVVNKYDSLPYTDITLKRISSNLEVNILDAPNRGPDTDNISVSITPEASFYSFAFEQSGYNWDETPIRNITRKSLNTFSDYVLNTDTEFSVIIKYTDKISGSFFTKTIPNVRCYMNKKTILTGNIFGANPPDSTDGFKVKVNDTWEPDGEIIPF
jgi:hypothetical protein